MASLIIALLSQSSTFQNIISHKPPSRKNINSTNTMSENSEQGAAGTLADPKLLAKIDQLREINVGQHVPLPQLVVVGDQSSGKSSLLESLTGIPFPRNLGLCTRYATQITSRRDNDPRVDISIIPGPSATDEHRNRLAEYRPSGLSPRDFRDQFPGILREVNKRMGIRTDTSSTGDKVFSEDVLKVEISGPNEDYLTLIDVPGIFRNAEGITTKEDVALVEQMVKNYIQDSRTVILAVLPSNVDLATQGILSLAKEHDKEGIRTLGVLTKPDLVVEESAKLGVCNVANNKNTFLRLGYYVVRNRGADENDDFDRSSVEQMFKQHPWNTLPQDRVGVHALKARLGELLGQIAKREFPALRKDIKRQLDETSEELKGLGPSRQTEIDQRLYLSKMSERFQALVQNALKADYSSHKAFEKCSQLRLGTRIANLTDNFNSEFTKKSQMRYFQDEYKNDEENGDAQDDDLKTEDENFTSSSDNSTKTVVPPKVRNADEVLQGIISDKYDFDDPETGIMDWIERLYVEYRGRELGIFGENILSSAFQEQSKKWEGMAKAYVSDVIIAIHQFIGTALHELFTDANVREAVQSSIADELSKRYKEAMELATHLVSTERHHRPFTLNHYFNENLQKSRAERLVKMLEDKVRREAFWESPGTRFRTQKPFVYLEDIKSATTNKSNLKHVTEEIHDILCAYYKVARKRFADNVHQQVVEHCLLTGPENPLSVFTPEWVIKLDAEKLDEVAGELASVREDRANLQKKINDLEEAMKILKS